MKVIKETHLPYLEFPQEIREEVRSYRVLELNGEFVFEKRLKNRSSLQHEAEILMELDGVVGVPRFQGLTGVDEDGMFGLRTDYHAGSLLSEVAGRLSFLTLIRAYLSLFQTLVAVHKRGVAHGDLRPWNVIWNGCRGTLIDFEEGRKYGSLPGPVSAYLARRSQQDEVHVVLKDIKDFLSTALYGLSMSRSFAARWVARVSPSIVRRFQLPKPGHDVLRSDR